MNTYEITAEAEGKAVVTVQAESADEARIIAYQRHLHGILIEGGDATWSITNVSKVAE